MSRLRYYTRDITQVAKESVEEENRGELDVCVVELREIKIREGGWNWGRVSINFSIMGRIVISARQRKLRALLRIEAYTCYYALFIRCRSR